MVCCIYDQNKPDRCRSSAASSIVALRLLAATNQDTTDMMGPSPSSQTSSQTHWNESRMLQPEHGTLSVSSSQHITAQCSRWSEVFSFQRLGSVPERHVVSQFVNGGNAHYFQLLSFNLELALLRRLLSKRVRVGVQFVSRRKRYAHCGVRFA